MYYKFNWLLEAVKTNKFYRWPCPLFQTKVGLSTMWVDVNNLHSTGA